LHKKDGKGWKIGFGEWNGKLPRGNFLLQKFANEYNFKVVIRAVAR